MKLFRRAKAAAAALPLLFAIPCFLANAQLSQWARNVVAATPLESALFRLMDGPDGAVPGRRTPTEARAQLSSLLQADSQSWRLYSLRALEEERQLDDSAAEADWRRAAELSSDKAAAFEDLASFYQRRVEHAKQVSALLDAANQPLPPADALLPEPSQTASWKDFEHAVQAARDSNLPDTAARRIYEAWLTRWPAAQSGIYLEYFRFLLDRGDKPAATAVLARFNAEFPHDWPNLLQANEALEDSPAAKLALYANQFSADLPDTLLHRYYELLDQTHQLRAFLSAARAAHQAQPTALDPVLKQAFYHEQSGRPQTASQLLRDFAASRDPGAWAASELKTTGHVFARLHDYDEESKIWYTLYSLPAASASEKKDALVSLADVLLDASEQPIQFGSRDLSLYRNIAVIDSTPGFLNGILSFALNSTFPGSEYNSATQTSIAYFHRAAASQLAARLTREFPSATEDREHLDAKLFTVYGLYGQDQALLSQLPAFLRQHRHAAAYVDLALLLGDVYARNHKETEEFALYDSLLSELAVKFGRVPLGDQPASQSPNDAAVTSAPRSAGYSRVLDRYIARLVEAKRLRDAIALFRREIHDNPADPGLYARLAVFVEQNRFDADLEQTYRDAMRQFGRLTWSEKLARLYLRRRRFLDYQRLAQQITDVFTGDDLETYLRDVPPSSALNPALFLRVNLYAHSRFPHNVTFIQNLLTAYRTSATSDVAAADRLLRENWFCDPELREEYFRRLSATGRLRPLLAALPTPEAAARSNNTVALSFQAEGQSWFTNYESAAPAFAQLARLTPGDLEANRRALSVHRSLSYRDPAAFGDAAAIGENNLRAAPGSSADLSTQGELYAEREQFPQAVPYWNRLAAINPGLSDGFLDAATIYWDYFRYDDALRSIANARRDLKRPALYAYEAGAIYENKLDLPKAVDEYVQGALLGSANDGPQASQCQARLIRLSRRNTAASLIDQKTTAALAADPSLRAFHLRLALLEAKAARDGEQKLLDQQIARQSTPEAVLEVRRDAARLGFPATEEQALQRLIALTADPVEKLRARLDLAAFHEDRNGFPSAEPDISSLLSENPTVLGIIRAAADFYERNKQPAKAAAVLEASAARAEPAYRRELLREAATRELEATNYDASRKLLDTLLAPDPYNASLLAAKAETWSIAGDISSLAAFYQTELSAIQSADFAPNEKIERIAGLRRGYIVALERLGRFTEAADQYVEVLNRFPEDEQLLAGAAQLANAHQLNDRLLSYYKKAAADSPKDFRWPMVLARFNVLFGNYPEAIAAYERASYVRPDRTDFLIAKADLETRLLRFEEALATNRRLYTLTYRNPQYLDAQSTLLARLGRKDQAIQTVRAALLNGRPANWPNYLAAAQRLVSWNLYDEAKKVLEEGLAQTTLAPHQVDGYDLYLRVLTIQRQPDQAVKLVSDAVATALKQQQTFESSLWMSAIGETVAQYFTPEEKAALANRFSAPGHIPQNVNFRAFLRVAGFGELYARYLNQQAASHPVEWQALDQYQHSRLRLAELAHQLEALPPSQTPGVSIAIQSAFTRAYLDAGSRADLIRLLQTGAARDLDTARYAWMIAADPSQYASRIPATDVGTAIVENLVRTTDEKRSFAAIEARSVQNTWPLWTSEATALTGLYYLSSQPQVAASFERLLGPRAVQAQLAALSAPPGDSLRGTPWFHLAAPFGDYLTYQQQAAAPDYTSAALELSPAASDAYIELGDTFRDAKQPAKARQQYEYAAQLSPSRAVILDRLAVLDWEAGDYQKAIEKWNKAFSVLRDAAPSSALVARSLLSHVNQAGVLSGVKPAADAMLHLYIKQNGAYQFEPIVAGALDHAPSRNAAIAWLVELSRDENGAEILQTLADSSSLSNSERDAAYQEMIQRAQRAASSATGDAARDARAQVNSRRLAYAAYLDTEGRYPRALEILEAVQPESERPADIRLRLIALNGRLDALIQTWRGQPSQQPRPETLLEVAHRLEDDGHTAEANTLLETAYTSAIAAGNASAADYFGLAKLRLSQTRTDEALHLLRVAVVTRGAPFENSAQAARMLDQAGLSEAARQYYMEWRTAEPWNPEARLALAVKDHDASALGSIRQTAAVLYSTRVAAARALRAAKLPLAGSEELDVLTRPTATPAAASRPYFVAARLDAAAQLSDPAARAKLYADAIAANPRLTEERRQLSRAASLAKLDSLAIAAYQSVAHPPDAIPRYARYGVPAPEHESDAVTELKYLMVESYLRLHRIVEAEALLPPFPTQARAKTLRDTIAAQRRLDDRNARRSPVLTVKDTFHQLVKPRLTQLPADPGGALE